MKQTLLVNLFGGPGTGKSTTAAGVFCQLKLAGIDCELVTEFAKDKVWEESFGVLNNQFYVTAKQHHKINRVYGKVDVIITDSPFILGLVYDKSKDQFFKHFVMSEFNKFDCLNVLLGRVKKYNPNGRTQKTLKEAKLVDEQIRGMLIENNVTHYDVVADKDGITNITKLIKKIIQRRLK